MHDALEGDRSRQVEHCGHICASSTQASRLSTKDMPSQDNCNTLFMRVKLKYTIYEGEIELHCL